MYKLLPVAPRDGQEEVAYGSKMRNELRIFVFGYSIL